MTRARVALAVALAALATGCATLASRGIPVAKAGGVLVDRASGMTLYHYDRDVAGSGKSSCAASCLGTQWTPLAASPTVKGYQQYEIVTAPDGTRLWAYKGKALYRHAADAKPGERNGDGVANLWRVAKP